MNARQAIRILSLLTVISSAPAGVISGDEDGSPPPTALVSVGGPATAVVGGPLQVSLTVDLTNVPGPCGSASAAVLGGYVVPVFFDKDLLSFHAATACSSPQFADAPTATDAATANATGEVVVTAVQTNASAPTGTICVATLTFEVLSTGSTKTAPGGELSLSSACQSCSGVLADPVSLPAKIAALELQLMEPVPTLDRGALVALALAIGCLAVVALRRRPGWRVPDVDVAPTSAGWAKR